MPMIQSEKTFVLSLPLPENLNRYYEIIYVPYNESKKEKNIKKYGFKLPSNATLHDYKAKFIKTAGLKPDTNFLLMQVYHNNIVKNYSTAKNDITLNELQLRQTDLIYAYELFTDFEDFVAKHYNRKIFDYQKELKIDQLVDCRNEKRGWIFGKISKKDYSLSGQNVIVKVIHKFSKGEQWEMKYNADQQDVAYYPTRSFLNAEQYHLRLVQRYFN